MKKKDMVVFVARDFNPSKNFGLLKRRFPEAVFFLGNGFDIAATDEEIKQAACNADVLILGMSHSQDAARVELLAGQVTGENTKIVLFADLFYCSSRSWFAPLRDRVNLVLTCTKSDVVTTKELFREAKVVSSSNSLWEENYFKVIGMRTDRKNIRGKLNVGGSEKLIFVPLRKESEINKKHLLVTLKSNVALSKTENNVSFCITTHPGEPDIENRLEEYKNIIKNNRQFQIVNLSTPEMLVSCDLVVNAASGVGVEALFLNIPVVEYLPKIVLDELEKLQDGIRTWQPCQDGAAFMVTNEDEMSDSIKKLLNPSSEYLTDMLKQHEFYKAPIKLGAAVELMATEINALIGN